MIQGVLLSLSLADSVTRSALPAHDAALLARNAALPARSAALPDPSQTSDEGDGEDRVENPLLEGLGNNGVYVCMYV